MEKIVYIDVETTGFNAIAQDLIQIALIVEVEGTRMEEAEFKCAPFNVDAASQQALDIHGYGKDEIVLFPEPHNTMVAVVALLKKYRYHKDDPDSKLIFAGYNCKFDIRFVEAWFAKCNNYQFNELFSYHSYDILALFRAYTKANSIWTVNHKLVTMAEYFGLEHNAHDAMSDIEVTYQSAKKLEECMKVPEPEDSMEQVDVEI